MISFSPAVGAGAVACDGFKRTRRVVFTAAFLRRLNRKEEGERTDRGHRTFFATGVSPRRRPPPAGCLVWRGGGGGLPTKTKKEIPPCPAWYGIQQSKKYLRSKNNTPSSTSLKLFFVQRKYPLANPYLLAATVTQREGGEGRGGEGGPCCKKEKTEKVPWTREEQKSFPYFPKGKRRGGRGQKMRMPPRI